VRAIKERVREFKQHCILIHLFQKVLDEVRVVVELVRADSLHVALIIALPLEEQLTKVFGKDECCVIARW